MATEEQTRSPHHELRETYGAPVAEAGDGNSVKVDPGGAVFPTIGSRASTTRRRRSSTSSRPAPARSTSR
jgi:hypothetical protein